MLLSPPKISVSNQRQGTARMSTKAEPHCSSCGDPVSISARPRTWAPTAHIIGTNVCERTIYARMFAFMRVFFFFFFLYLGSADAALALRYARHRRQPRLPAGRRKSPSSRLQMLRPSLAVVVFVESSQGRRRAKQSCDRVHTLSPPTRSTGLSKGAKRKKRKEKGNKRPTNPFKNDLPQRRLCNLAEQASSDFTSAKIFG